MLPLAQKKVDCLLDESLVLGDKTESPQKALLSRYNVKEGVPKKKTDTVVAW